MKMIAGLALATMLTAVACGQAATPEKVAPPTPTPNLEATVRAVVASLPPNPVSTLDTEATTTAGAQATVPESVAPRDAPDPTPSPSPAVVASPVPTDIPASPSPLPQDSVVVQVVRVIDGDTIEVVFDDGAVDTVRLLGIDTPETFSPNKPNEYGGITDIACLDKWGAQATTDVTDTLFGEVVILSRDARDSFGRLLAYVEFEGRDFNAALVEEGLARVYTEGESSREAEYLALQEAARRETVGLWQCEQ
jgi:micrococcal nuclease